MLLITVVLDCLLLFTKIFGDLPSKLLECEFERHYELQA